MIRAEIVLKRAYGSHIDGTATERRLKAEITEAVTERAKVDDLEIVRIQFLGAPPKPAKKRPLSVAKKASA